MLLRRGRLIVDDALLMYNDGRLLSHVARRITPDMDSEIFSSMLTAIQDFVQDSFSEDGEGGVNKIEFRDKRIAIENSESGLVSLALIYRGKGNEERLTKKAKGILEDVDKQYGEVLEDWDGSMDDVKGAKEILTKGLK
jgi:OOP family OmpA-OmpF porin